MRLFVFFFKFLVTDGEKVLVGLPVLFEAGEANGEYFNFN